MRVIASLIILSLPGLGTGLRAQGVVFGHPPVPSAQPTFRIKQFSTALVLPSLQKRVFDSQSPPIDTCPMPVARADSSPERMPVARGGTSEPMPVAKSGCWNPLGPQP
jgi:hypothetical protein